MEQDGQMAQHDITCSDDDVLMLQRIEQRVLWLTTYLLHYSQ